MRRFLWTVLRDFCVSHVCVTSLFGSEQLGLKSIRRADVGGEQYRWRFEILRVRFSSSDRFFYFSILTRKSSCFCCCISKFGT